MKRTLLFGVALMLLAAVSATAEEITINGAGATFPYPVYSQWAYKYNKLTGMKLNYQSIGSGGGIAQIKAKTVDFGASDAPLEPKELQEAGLLQFPMVIGGVVPVINVPGIESGQLRLTGDTLAQIFLGNITKWNDPAIAAINKDIKLPDTAITVVHRADGSGTTWIFTDYLNKVSKKWSAQVGAGKAVAWPVGIGGKGNEGVASYVQQVASSIGYVEYAYALQNNMAHVLLKNRDGAYVEPVIETFQAAAANADWKSAPGFYVVLTDQPGEKSWPITGASFILVYEKQGDPKRTKAMLSFFDWCYRHGDEIARELHYVPMPMNVVDLVEAAWGAKLKADGKPIWP
jgi:phosphate transport system substrate-binding protein